MDINNKVSRKKKAVNDITYANPYRKAQYVLKTNRISCKARTKLNRDKRKHVRQFHNTGLQSPCGICDFYARGDDYCFENHGRKEAFLERFEKEKKISEWERKKKGIVMAAIFIKEVTQCT